MTTVKLTTPVEFKGTVYTELSFGKPKVKNLKDMDHGFGETGKMIALLASLSGVPIPAFDEIDLDDFAAISEAAGAMLGKSLASTGDGSI